MPPHQNFLDYLLNAPTEIFGKTPDYPFKKTQISNKNPRHKIVRFSSNN